MWSHSLRSPHENPVCTCLVPRTCHMPHLSHPPWFHHLYNMVWRTNHEAPLYAVFSNLLALCSNVFLSTLFSDTHIKQTVLQFVHFHIYVYIIRQQMGSQKILDQIVAAIARISSAFLRISIFNSCWNRDTLSLICITTFIRTQRWYTN